MCSMFPDKIFSHCTTKTTWPLDGLKTVVTWEPSSAANCCTATEQFKLCLATRMLSAGMLRGVALV